MRGKVKHSLPPMLDKGRGAVLGSGAMAGKATCCVHGMALDTTCDECWVVFRSQVGPDEHTGWCSACQREHPRDSQEWMEELDRLALLGSDPRPSLAARAESPAQLRKWREDRVAELLDNEPESTLALLYKALYARGLRIGSIRHHKPQQV